MRVVQWWRVGLAGWSAAWIVWSLGWLAFGVRRWWWLHVAAIAVHVVLVVLRVRDVRRDRRVAAGDAANLIADGVARVASRVEAREVESAAVAESPSEPDVVEGSVYGWRRWSLPEDGTALLASDGPRFYGGSSWAPDGLRASCSQLRDPLRLVLSRADFHDAPHESCQCGIYAWASLPDALSHGGYGDILGLVEGWGKVIHHESGWRSEYARPAILVAHDISHAFVKRLAKVYGCEVVKCRPWDEAIIEATSHLQATTGRR